jgi:hypothetical protein
VFRHTALFLLRETTTPEQQREMLRGLESLLEECPTVRGGDCGSALRDTRGTRDVALHLDFDDPEGYRAYVAHPVHVEVSGFNASLSVDGATARIDWRYDGPPRVNPGGVRHCEAFTWSGGAEPSVLAAAAALSAMEGVLSTVAVVDSGDDPRASDWILDVELADEAAARAFLTGDAYREFSNGVAASVDASRTARVTHIDHGRSALRASPVPR